MGGSDNWPWACKAALGFGNGGGNEWFSWTLGWFGLIVSSGFDNAGSILFLWYIITSLYTWDYYLDLLRDELVPR